MRSVVLTACTVALVCSAKADPPQNYYAAAANKTGAELKSALHDIIDDHRVVRYSSKNPDTADALARLDADPEQPKSVVLIYSRRSEPVSNFGTSSGWNREHLWPNSYGIDKRGPAYSDLHNLRPADASVNSARSNKIYDTSDVKDERYQRPGHREAVSTLGTILYRPDGPKPPKINQLMVFRTSGTRCSTLSSCKSRPSKRRAVRCSAQSRRANASTRRWRRCLWRSPSATPPRASCDGRRESTRRSAPIARIRNQGEQLST